MMGYWTAIVSVATGLGPLAGGVAVSTLGWRSIFLINIPIGIIGIFLAIFLISKTEYKPVKISYINNLLLFIALSSLSFVLIEGGAAGWVSFSIITSALVGLLAFFVFFVREKKGQTRILSVSLINNRTFLYYNGVAIFINTSLFGLIYLLSVYLQRFEGNSPIQTGLSLFPIMMVFAVANLIYAHLTRWIDARYALMLGLVLAAIGPLFLGLGGFSQYWMLVGGMVISNLGVGLAVPSMTYLIMTAADGAEANIASATLNSSRQCGSLLGVALTGILLNEIVNGPALVRAGFMGAGVIYATGFIVSSLLALRVKPGEVRS